jgi:hypothetical protein
MPVLRKGEPSFVEMDRGRVGDQPQKRSTPSEVRKLRKLRSPHDSKQLSAAGLRPSRDPSFLKIKALKIF